MSFIGLFKIYLTGPRLFRIFPNANAGSPGRSYIPNTIEWFADTVIKSFSLAMSMSFYFSPIFAYYFLRRGNYVVICESISSNFAYISRCMFMTVIGLSGAAIIRGYGRFSSNDYRRFATVFHRVNNLGENKGFLRAFDFEFYAWPVDFRWNGSSSFSKKSINVEKSTVSLSWLDKITHLPLNIVDYMIAHGVARPMVYPGSVSLMHLALSDAIVSGRAMLTEKKGQRAKLLSEDGNEIDTMFIDKRLTSHDNGKTLVICCEGNAGFYEVGIIGTPKKAGYSVLGWNHPGFAGSSGLPFPDADKNAIDVVMQYALTDLGFRIEEIVIFAWSIGGYPATYAAMAYPDIKSLIVDASFDSIYPLAIERMPPVLTSTVNRVLKNYFDLNHTEQIIKYDGPIRLIRRSREEIITTIPDRPSSNRGNDLLIKLLRHRYPNVMTDRSETVLRSFLAESDHNVRDSILSSLGLDIGACSALIESYTGGNRPSFPCDLGEDWDDETKSQMALYLTTKYLDHFDATHCIPLPSSYFKMPWDHK